MMQKKKYIWRMVSIFKFKFFMGYMVKVQDKNTRIQGI